MVLATIAKCLSYQTPQRHNSAISQTGLTDCWPPDKVGRCSTIVSVTELPSKASEALPGRVRDRGREAHQPHSRVRDRGREAHQPLSKEFLPNI